MNSVWTKRIGWVLLFWPVLVMAYSFVQTLRDPAQVIPVGRTLATVFAIAWVVLHVTTMVTGVKLLLSQAKDRALGSVTSFAR